MLTTAMYNLKAMDTLDIELNFIHLCNFYYSKLPPSFIHFQAPRFSVQPAPSLILTR